MKKLFTKEILLKIKKFNIEDFTFDKNDKEYTSISFNPGYIVNGLSAYVTEGEYYYKKIYVTSSTLDLQGSNLQECIGILESFIKDKQQLIFDVRSFGMSAAMAFENNDDINEKIIKRSLTSVGVGEALIFLYNIVNDGKFYVNEELYEEIVKELESIEYDGEKLSHGIFGFGTFKYDTFGIINNLILISDVAKIKESEDAGKWL